MSNKPFEDMTLNELETLHAELQATYGDLKTRIATAREASDAHSEKRDAFHREMRPFEKELLEITKAVAAEKTPSRPFKEAFDQQQKRMRQYDEMCLVQLTHYRDLSCLYDEAEQIDRQIDEVERSIRIRKRNDANASIRHQEVSRHVHS